MLHAPAWEQRVDIAHCKWLIWQKLLMFLVCSILFWRQRHITLRSASAQPIAIHRHSKPLRDSHKMYYGNFSYSVSEEVS